MVMPRVCRFRCRLLALVTALALVSVCGHSAACSVEAHASEPAAQHSYVPAVPFAERLEHLGSFSTQGDYAGTLIQTIAFDYETCQWVAAISASRKPETVALAAFPAVAPFVSTYVTAPVSVFAHPQDLSISGKGGDKRFWLPGKTRKNIIGFSLDSAKHVVSDYEIVISRKPVRGLFSSVSREGRKLFVLGAFGGKGSRRQVVKVYNLPDMTQTPGRLDLTAVKPIKQWELGEDQQDHTQWVQGFATYGDSIYVLTGNAKKTQTKFLAAYDLEGELMSVNELPTAASGKLMAGKVRTYEPEGLEVIDTPDGAKLAFGLAGGTKGKRTYDLWAIPLTRQ